MGAKGLKHTLVGWPGAFQPPAPTDPGVNLSVHRALVILVTRRAGPKEPISSARTCGDTFNQPACRLFSRVRIPVDGKLLHPATDNFIDRRNWSTREELGLAIAVWIERIYHRRRR